MALNLHKKTGDFLTAQEVNRIGEEVDKNEKSIKAINEYITRHNLKTDEQDDRLHYLETKVGIIPTKQWKSGEITEQGQPVVMHGEFFVAVKATRNPPMWTLMDKDGNRLTDKDGNYLLTGVYNRTEYQQF